MRTTISIFLLLAGCMPKSEEALSGDPDLQPDQDIVDIMNSDLEDIPIPEAEDAERSEEDEDD
jgi:hypothetical protein